jgi:hypothetical protein
MPKLSCAQLRDHLVLRHNHLSSGSSFVLAMLCILMIRIRRYLFAYFTWKTLSNHVFEDLRKPKAPNTADSAGCGEACNFMFFILVYIMCSKSYYKLILFIYHLDRS